MRIRNAAPAERSARERSERSARAALIASAMRASGCRRGAMLLVVTAKAVSADVGPRISKRCLTFGWARRANARVPGRGRKSVPDQIVSVAMRRPRQRAPRAFGAGVSALLLALGNAEGGERQETRGRA